MNELNCCSGNVCFSAPIFRLLLCNTLLTLFVLKFKFCVQLKCLEKGNMTRTRHFINIKCCPFHTLEIKRIYI